MTRSGGLFSTNFSTSGLWLKNRGVAAMSAARKRFSVEVSSHEPADMR